jgi:signal transduction histidine kinase
MKRLWLYGLLLLLPALAVGGLALGLLAREQARLAEREQAANEARRAAVETRARLIAENIELLVGDVQTALMATLQEAPPEEPRAFLNDWQGNNPLVRDVFRATADGRLVWGAGQDSLREWLAAGAPWQAVRAKEKKLARLELSEPEGQVAEALTDAASSRRDISSNVQQYQRARQEIQAVAQLKNSVDYAAKAVSAPAGAAVPAAAAPAAPVATSADVRMGMKHEELARGTAADIAFDERLNLGASVVGFSATSGSAMTPAIVSGGPAGRTGWTPWRDAGGLHLFGWRELADGSVIGLELGLDAIKARLAELFPATPEVGEGYALRDASGAVWHRIGLEPVPAVIEVPLADATLPGWTVVGALAGGYDSLPQGGFFALGATLVALLVLAILAAGALLLRQARLSEAESAAKTSFVANVSHELKTPLTTIRLYAELLAQGRVRDETKRAEYLDTIGRETQRLGRLVGNVLDFSRLEQGKKKYELAPVDLVTELRRLGEAHAPRLAEAGLVLRIDAPEQFPLATDRDAVGQIVLNLLDNACKYAADGGEVLLSLASGADEDGSARIAVADRGSGVPAEQRERIFEKFHRVDERLTAEKAGAGLGLSIARQLARGLGGELRCEAREGGGSVFVLTLPSHPSA